MILLGVQSMDSTGASTMDLSEFLGGNGKFPLLGGLHVEVGQSSRLFFRRKVRMISREICM